MQMNLHERGWLVFSFLWTYFVLLGVVPKKKENEKKKEKTTAFLNIFPYSMQFSFFLFFFFWWGLLSGHFTYVT